MNRERFWGLHFDFHAGDDSKVGINTNAEDIERYLLSARPDFIQCDCKGHPGIACYPTKVGRTSKQYVADNLKVWVETAHKHNIPVYIHYSGVIDEAYCKEHPEHECLDKEGNVKERNNCVSLFSPYVTDFLIPQVKEVITNYNIDGIWVDGDCWAVDMDYSPLANKALGDDTDEERKLAIRDKFFEYARTYVDELHAFKPDFMITSNWAYTSRIPELPKDRNINIDYISGDLAPNNSVHEARHEARFIALRGLPWDIMSWGFNNSDKADKSAVQLIQEASVVMSNGGGFQIYDTQNRDGSARKIDGKRLEIISNFVKERKFLFNKKPFADFGVLFDSDDFYAKSKIFNAGGCLNPIIGMVNALLDVGRTVNILLSSQEDEYKNHKALVVAQLDKMSDERVEKLVTYVRNGGKLLVVGEDISIRFLDKTGGKYNGKRTGRVYINDGEYFSLAHDIRMKAETMSCLDLGDGEGYLYSDRSKNYPLVPAYRIDKIGKGCIAYLPLDFGNWYLTFANLAKQGYIKNIADTLVESSVVVDKKNIDITTQKDGDAVIINLVNINQGRHSLSYTTYDEVDPIEDITVKINIPYKSVSLPFNEAHSVEYKDDCVIIKLDKLDIHTAIICK